MMNGFILGHFFGLSFLIGCILLTAYAIKNLKKEKLLGIGLILVGIAFAGSLLAVSMHTYQSRRIESGYSFGPGMMLNTIKFQSPCSKK